MWQVVNYAFEKSKFHDFKKKWKEKNETEWKRERDNTKETT